MTNFRKTGSIFIISIAMLLLGACGSGVDNNTDQTAGTITLTNLNDGNNDEDVVGNFIITWENTEPFRSTVDIELSSNSGEDYQSVEPLTLITDAVECVLEDDKLCVPDSEEVCVPVPGTDYCEPESGHLPDTGTYKWDTNTVLDCRKCRIRITATDIAGNVSGAVESAVDFVINNVPQVLGSALYVDTGNNGVGDGDTIIIPFDKPVELNATVAGDAFFVPVLADGIGPFSTMSLGASENEVVITINDLMLGSLFHLHIGGRFDATTTHRTAPSGLDILDNLSGEIIFSPDTGRTAEPVGDGIDIAPTFGNEYSSAITTADTIAVAIADLDGTGELDLVTLNVGNEQDIWFNTATPGIFINSGNASLGGAGNTSLAIGNVDGDDDLDIIVGNTGTSLVFTNDSGVFAPLAQGINFDTVTGTQAVALADVDNKNGVDVIMGVNGVNRVFFNNGSGVFNDSGQSLGNNDTRAVALGDIDGINGVDLVFGNNGANVVYFNNGSGDYTIVATRSFGSANTRSVQLGDIDADGDLDLVTGNDNSQANRVFLNDGVGMFTDSGQALGDSNTRFVVLHDVDRDGDIDLVAGNNNQASKIWVNDGAGFFSDSSRSFGSVNATQSIAVGDVDGDGDPDLVTGLTGVSDLIWLNSQRVLGQVIFLDTDQALGSDVTNAIASRDVDGDGDIDLVTGNSAGNRVWLNDATGVYNDSSQSLGSSNTFAVALGNVDGDVNGSLDLVTGNTGGSNRVWLNDATGMFNDSGQALESSGSRNTESIALDDIDNDGDLDLVTGNSDGANRVWRNSSSGSFSEDDTPQTLGSSITFAVKLGDVDDDGDLDLIAGNFTQSDQVWLNNGIGVFSADQILNTIGNNNTTSLDLGDVDGDGYLDLVVGNSTQDHLLWINDGSASNMFSGPTMLTNSNSTTSVTLSDIDSDGSLDLLIGYADRDNELYLNDGRGNFSAATESMTNNNNGSNMLIVSDIDSDGDDDVIFDDNFDGSIKIWANDF